MRRFASALGVCALLTGGMSAVGCSSAEAPAGDGCVGSASEALKTCAKGATITGVDVSYYQGNVNWSQVKGSGRDFAFVRISDGLDYPDSKFAQNWPALKAAGLVRGAYQFFRPAQDAGLQAQLLLDRLAAAGGLRAGDLPPVLDLESAGGLASSVVVARAKAWLAKVEAATGAKPIVYTAAFMSNVIGDSFSGYTLWVANYETTCPTMPSGWTDWHFWQSSDSGSVAGIAGNVDVDFFNGTLAALDTLTLKPAADPVDEPDPRDFLAPAEHSFGDDKPNDGSQGSTLGSGDGSQPVPETQSAPITPCL